MKRSSFDQSAIKNNGTFNDYYTRLKVLAMSLFKWNGLPESCDARFLELCLFDNGKAVFIKDPDLGFMNLRVVWAGNLNVYELPVQYQAFSISYSKIFNKDECVLIMNNLLMYPTAETISLFSERLYEAERTVDTNIKAQKTPVLLTCNKNQELTLKNLYMKYDGNQPFIFGDKEQNLEKMINSIKTDAPFITDKVQDYKHQIWNECLTFLGIDNANTDKAERLITDEVESNNELIGFNFNNFLKTRQQACEQINKMFGLNVSVEMDSNVQKQMEQTTDEMINFNKDESKEGDQNV